MEEELMNKTNKNLGLAMRIAIIVTWIMSNINLFVLLSGFSNFDTSGLDKDSSKSLIAERLLKIIGDIAGNTTFYYVTFGMIFACLVLAVVSRYKTTLVSFIFKIVGLGFALIFMGGGLEYIGALSSCKGLTNLTIEGTSTDAVQAALSSAGLSDDVEKVAKTLTNKDEALAAFGGYIFPILILFILMITSIHCLVKKSDPNNKGSIEKQ